MRSSTRRQTDLRALFVAEAVSLAHVARPVRLAAELDADWEIHFASADRYRNCFDSSAWQCHLVESIEPSAFLSRLESGKPLYTQTELERYVQDDLRMLEAVSPDVVIGDFRLSLGVSARAAGVPYVSICNAHWSPFARIGEMPVPEIDLVRWLGLGLAAPIFRLGFPLALRWHARPINRLRRRFGLAAYPDLRSAYTDGDLALFADTERLVPTSAADASHRYLGPIVWSPAGSLPSWWERLPQGRALAYVTLGSTGRAELLPMAMDVVTAAGFAVMASTAGRVQAEEAEDRFVAEFLPGEQAAERADVVICNGGSATVYQALSVGTPVIGLCSNLDQFLTMEFVQRAGAGVRLRAADVTAEQLRQALTRASSAAAREAAAAACSDFASYRIGERLREGLGSLLESRPPATRENPRET